MAAANQVVKLGLKDVGYEYINSTFPLMPSIKIPSLTSHPKLTTAGPSNPAATEPLKR
tara:strand:- start:1691 stop:1864 length:174 start_codon:yes stop_codon:yes gene_type:complete